VKPPAPARKPEKGGGIITGKGTGGGPRAGLLVGVAGPAADGSTRAAAIAGGMLGVLAAAVSLVRALYKFKPGVIKAGVGSSTDAGAPAAVDQTQGNQETPLLLPMTAQNGPSAASGGAASQPVDTVQTTDVDLANYFSPMPTTTRMTRGVQVDLDSGAGMGWAASSALASHSSVDEVTKSRSGSGDGGGTMNIATQTAHLQADVTGHVAATGGKAYSAYSYQSHTSVTDTTRDISQVCASSVFYADVN